MGKRKKRSIEADMQDARGLLRKGKLGAVFENLDAKDIPGSLRHSSLAVIRLLMGLLSVSDIEKKVKQVDPEQREVAEALLKCAKEHDVGSFFNALGPAVMTDKQVRDLLGVDITAVPKTLGYIDAKTFNTITGISHTPQLMLKSSRLYVQLGFLQGDEVLFRSQLELDELLLWASDHMDAAKEALTLLKQKAPIASPKLETERCTRYLLKIRQALRELPRLIAEFGQDDQPPLPAKRRTKSKRRTTRRLTQQKRRATGSGKS